jgi:DNA primase
MQNIFFITSLHCLGTLCGCGFLADQLSKSVASKDRHERDIDETKYIGEEKVVEEERKTVAQLKEIFAQDKRDRQYERQPPISEQLPTAPSVKPKKEKMSPPSMLEDICKVSATEGSIQVTPPVQKEVSLISKSTVEDGISTLEKDVSKKQPSPPPSVRTEADQRRDSELFQGVTEELVRLETTCKVIPAAEGKALPFYVILFMLYLIHWTCHNWHNVH